MTGAERIAAERRRQIEAEGWTPDHDAEHTTGDLAYAAAAYAIAAAGGIGDMSASLSWWPWSNECWKPSTPLRNLEKAGALIAAEIDRLVSQEAHV